jgi:hypothetical protein
MAIEDIGAIYNTKIPGLADAADIQEALKLYHYGSLSYDVNNEDTGELLPSSMASHLNVIQEFLDYLDAKRTAGDLLDDAPTDIADGYIWLDSSASAPEAAPAYVPVYYSATAPAENLTTGIVWIDSADDLNTAYVWDDTLSDWVSFNNFNPLVVENKGDLIVGTGSGEYDKLVVGTDDYVLTADSASSTGVSWKAPQQLEKSFEVELIMGVY